MIGLFNGHFIDVKAFYAMEFGTLSCISFIGELNTSKAFTMIRETMNAEVRLIYQHTYFNHAEQKMFFNNTIFVLTNKRIIELGNNYCQLLHRPGQHGWANAVIKSLSSFREMNHEPAIGFTRQAAVN